LSERHHMKDNFLEADMAIGGVERLNRLISDILDVARLDQGIFRVDIQPIDLTGLAHEIAKVLSTPDQQIIVDAAEETVVAADAQRTQQCVDNLIAKAVPLSTHGAAMYDTERN